MNIVCQQPSDSVRTRLLKAALECFPWANTLKSIKASLPQHERSFFRGWNAANAP